MVFFFYYYYSNVGEFSQWEGEFGEFKDSKSD